jgi:hypothetical protein
VETTFMPKLIWKDEKSFHGWGCDQCGFILPDPRFLDALDGYAAQARNDFAVHECTKHPQKRREDFSQAAARIVREASEGK